MHEGVRAAHRLLEPHVDLGVGVADRPGRHDLDPHQRRPPRRPAPGRPAREQHQVLVVGLLEAGHWSSLPRDLLVLERRGSRSVDLDARSSPSWRWSSAASAARAVLVPARFRATQPGTLRCRPRATASSPIPTSPVIVEPAATYAPSAISHRCGEHGVAADEAVRAHACGGLGDPVVVGEDHPGADVGAVADHRVARRRSGAGPWPRRRSGRSWSPRRCRSCRRRPAWCRAAGTRTGRRWRPAPITLSEPWVRTTVAPSPTSTSISVVSGPMVAPAADRGRALQRGARQQRDVGRRGRPRRAPRCWPGRRPSPRSRIQRSQDPPVHLGVHRRQLDPVVDPFGLPQVVGQARPPTVRPARRAHASARRSGRARPGRCRGQLGQSRPQHVGLEDVDAGVDLVDRPLRRRRRRGARRCRRPGRRRRAGSARSRSGRALARSAR